jgi:hypothetical protein
LLAFLLRLEFSSFEFGAEKLAIPMAGNRKARRKCVDRLGADTVQADTKLKDVIVVLRAGINLGNAIDHFAQWDSAAVIPDPDEGLIDGYVDLATVAHDEFIDGIIDHLFEEDIDAVIVMAAVPQTANVHSSTGPDVFQGGEGFNLTFVVIVLSGRHGRSRSAFGVQRVQSGHR